MIKLRFPALIDYSILKTALEVAARSNTSVQIETFVRVIIEGMPVDCDTYDEALALAQSYRAPEPNEQVDARVDALSTAQPRTYRKRKPPTATQSAIIDRILDGEDAQAKSDMEPEPNTDNEDGDE